MFVQSHLPQTYYTGSETVAARYNHPHCRPSCVTVTTLPRTLTLKL